MAWFRYAETANFRRLKEGIPVGNFVVRNGTQGYKVSVWQHDARVFLTDQVDAKLGEDKGMGIWVQLGPKFIIQHTNNLHLAVKELLEGIGISGDYPINITRIDIAVDLPGVSMKDQDLNIWRFGWVGRSKLSAVYFNSRSGELETINIGSRQSAVFLRIYNKFAQAVKEGDIDYWWDVWGENLGEVTRVEWEIKPNEGGFVYERDFNTFNGFSVVELLNYLVNWGKLCIPNDSDSNNRRWKEAPFWEQLKKVVYEWANEINWPTSRKGKEFHGISEAYAKFVSGTLSGAMARFSEESPSIIRMIEGLEKYGEGFDVINKKADRKRAIYSRL